MHNFLPLIQGDQELPFLFNCAYSIGGPSVKSMPSHVDHLYRLVLIKAEEKIIII